MARKLAAILAADVVDRQSKVRDGGAAQS
jgi:hypothetical protein